VHGCHGNNFYGLRQYDTRAIRAGSNSSSVSTVAFGKPIEGYFAAFWTPQGVIGLGTQIIFAFIPLIQRIRQ